MSTEYISDFFPEEKRTIIIDFSNTDELEGGDTLSTVSLCSITPSSGVVLTTGSISGNTALTTISNLSADTNYTLTMVVNTTGGSKLAAKPRIYCRGN